MTTTLLKPVMITFTVLFVLSSVKGQHQWDIAESKINRLPPAAFYHLPKKITSYLERERCTVPQYYGYAKPHNVIRGQFARIGQHDWAVLCSRNGISSTLIFWNGSTKKISEIAKSEDKAYLQTTDDPGGIGFSRVISAAGKNYIRDHARWYHGPKPPPITHQGIEDAFMEKASVILYYYRHTWLQLQGAD